MPIIFSFFIGKLYSIDNHETTNVFNMLDYLLANTNYTARQTEKHWFCRGARTFLTILIINNENSCSGDRMYL